MTGFLKRHLHPVKHHGRVHDHGIISEDQAEGLVNHRQEELNLGTRRHAPDVIGLLLELYHGIGAENLQGVPPGNPGIAEIDEPGIADAGLR